LEKSCSSTTGIFPPNFLTTSNLTHSRLGFRKRFDLIKRNDHGEAIVEKRNKAKSNPKQSNAKLKLKMPTYSKNGRRIGRPPKSVSAARAAAAAALLTKVDTTASAAATVPPAPKTMPYRGISRKRRRSSITSDEGAATPAAVPVAGPSAPRPVASSRRETDTSIAGTSEGRRVSASTALGPRRAKALETTEPASSSVPRRPRPIVLESPASSGSSSSSSSDEEEEAEHEEEEVEHEEEEEEEEVEHEEEEVEQEVDVVQDEVRSSPSAKALSPSPSAYASASHSSRPSSDDEVSSDGEDESASDYDPAREILGRETSRPRLSAGRRDSARGFLRRESTKESAGRDSVRRTAREGAGEKLSKMVLEEALGGTVGGEMEVAETPYIEAVREEKKEKKSRKGIGGRPRKDKGKGKEMGKGKGKGKGKERKGSGEERKKIFVRKPGTST
jgi:hypothetical protein